MVGDRALCFFGLAAKNMENILFTTELMWKQLAGEINYILSK